MNAKSYLIASIVFFCLSGCKNDHAKEQSNCTDNSLNGTWKLVQYFDSIQSQNTIAKYRMNELTWHSIILQIEGDSCHSLGSIYNMKFKINPCNDIMIRYNDFYEEMDDDWPIYNMYKEEDKIILQRIDSQKHFDDEKYIYKKTNDLKFQLTENRKKVFYQFDTLMESYFNNLLLSGTYLSEELDTVYFNTNRSLSGVKEFEAYKINNYFGTYHPFNNMDVVYLLKNNEHHPYHWIFKDDTLILNEFISDQSGDYFELGDFTFKLKRIKRF